MSWSAARLARAAALRDAGHDYAEIAEQLGDTTVDAVSSALRRARIGLATAPAPPPAEPDPLDGLSPSWRRRPAVTASDIPRTFSTLRRILLVPDTHAPFEDKRAWSCMLRAARVFRPDIIVHLGDLIDCYSLSHYPKSPVRRETFEQELAGANRCLDDLDSLGATQKLFCEGNHEARLTSYLTQKAPDLYGMMSMRELLKMPARGWEWHPYRTHATIGHLHVTHDEGNAGPYAPNRARATFGGNVVIGHTHRMGASYEGSAKGTSRVGMCVGWLGDVAQIDYMHRVRAHAWQAGFGVGYLEESGTVHLQAVPIIDYRCVIEGQLYEVAA